MFDNPLQNILDTIPPALRDRMEVLRLLGYTEDEKIKIANRYLIPRQRKEHGLKADQISFAKGAVKKIVDQLFTDYGKVIGGAMGRDLQTHDHEEAL